MKTITGLKFTVRFYLEKRRDPISKDLRTDDLPILMTVTWNGNRVAIYLGHHTDSKNWVDNTKAGDPLPYVKNNTMNKFRIAASVINASIREHNRLVEEIFHEVGKDYPSANELREMLNVKLGRDSKKKFRDESDLFEYFQQYIEEVNVTMIRKKNLATTMRHFQSFFHDKRLSPEFSHCTPELISEFERYLRSGKGRHRKGKNGSPIVLEVRAKNTVSVILTRLRAFFYYAQKRQWTKKNPFKDYKVLRQVYGEPIFLTKEERDRLFEYEPNNPTMTKVRDQFLLQCFIGARISDMLKLKRDNIIDNSIQYIPEKSKGRSQKVLKVPLAPKAIEIISRYDVPNGDLLPYMSLQKFNVYLKTLFQRAGIDRKVVWLNPRTGKTEVRPIYEIASSHMGRRTFIGLQYKAGVKNEVISKMSGHKEGSNSFRRYYNIDFDDLVSAVKTIE